MLLQHCQALQVSSHWPQDPALGLLGAGKLPVLCLSCSQLRLKSQARMQCNFPLSFFLFSWSAIILSSCYAPFWGLQFGFPFPFLTRSNRDLALGISLFCSVLFTGPLKQSMDRSNYFVRRYEMYKIYYTFLLHMTVNLKDDRYECGLFG